jgi:hypothetical protein
VLPAKTNSFISASKGPAANKQTSSHTLFIFSPLKNLHLMKNRIFYLDQYDKIFYAIPSFLNEVSMSVPAVENPYLKGNLHVKPISARLSRGVLVIATCLERSATPGSWKGIAVHVLSKTAFFIGGPLCIAVALTESLALFVIGTIGVLLNKWLCRNQCQCLQKHAVKCLSYALHSFGVAAGLFLLIRKNPNFRYYSPVAIADHALHLVSAAVIQNSVGGVIDRLAGRSSIETNQRILNLGLDGHPHMLNDLLAQFNRDFSIRPEQFRNIPSLEAYLTRHPEDRVFLSQFSFGRLQDPIYRQRTRECAERFLAEVGLAGPGGGLRVELNQVTPAEAAYQERLANRFQTAFLTIHDTPALASALDGDGYTGAERLVMLDASTFPPLTTYAQYLELRDPIDCPERFTGNLAPFSTRRAQLLAAQESLNRLSEEEKAALVQKILRGSDIAATPAVQAVFLSISRLAAPLTQGPLVTRVALNLNNIIRNESPVDATNLFQRGCQTALEEINRRH